MVTLSKKLAKLYPIYFWIKSRWINKYFPAKKPGKETLKCWCLCYANIVAWVTCHLWLPFWIRWCNTYVKEVYITGHLVVMSLKSCIFILNICLTFISTYFQQLFHWTAYYRTIARPRKLPPDIVILLFWIIKWAWRKILVSYKWKTFIWKSSKRWLHFFTRWGKVGQLRTQP